MDKIVPWDFGVTLNIGQFWPVEAAVHNSPKSLNLVSYATIRVMQRIFSSGSPTNSCHYTNTKI